MDAASSVEQVLLPLPDAAKALGVGRTTLFSLIGSGQLETVLIGRRRLVPAAALRDFAERLRHTSAA